MFRLNTNLQTFAVPAAVENSESSSNSQFHEQKLVEQFCRQTQLLKLVEGSAGKFVEHYRRSRRPEDLLAPVQVRLDFEYAHLLERSPSLLQLVLEEPLQFGEAVRYSVYGLVRAHLKTAGLKPIDIGQLHAQWRLVGLPFTPGLQFEPRDQALRLGLCQVQGVLAAYTPRETLVLQSIWYCSSGCMRNAIQTSSTDAPLCSGCSRPMSEYQKLRVTETFRLLAVLPSSAVQTPRAIGCLHRPNPQPRLRIKVRLHIYYNRILRRISYFIPARGMPPKKTLGSKGRRFARRTAVHLSDFLRGDEEPNSQVPAQVPAQVQQLDESQNANMSSVGTIPSVDQVDSCVTVSPVVSPSTPSVDQEKASSPRSPTPPPPPPVNVWFDNLPKKGDQPDGAGFMPDKLEFPDLGKQVKSSKLQDKGGKVASWLSSVFGDDDNNQAASSPTKKVSLLKRRHSQSKQQQRQDKSQIQKHISPEKLEQQQVKTQIQQHQVKPQIHQHISPEKQQQQRQGKTQIHQHTSPEKQRQQPPVKSQLQLHISPEKPAPSTSGIAPMTEDNVLKSGPSQQQQQLRKIPSQQKVQQQKPHISASQEKIQLQQQKTYASVSQQGIQPLPMSGSRSAQQQPKGKSPGRSAPHKEHLQPAISSEKPTSSSRSAQPQPKKKSPTQDTRSTPQKVHMQQPVLAEKSTSSTASGAPHKVQVQPPITSEKPTYSTVSGAPHKVQIQPAISAEKPTSSSRSAQLQPDGKSPTKDTRSAPQQVQIPVQITTEKSTSSTSSGAPQKVQMQPEIRSEKPTCSRFAQPQQQGKSPGCSASQQVHMQQPVLAEKPTSSTASGAPHKAQIPVQITSEKRTSSTASGAPQKVQMQQPVLDEMPTCSRYAQQQQSQGKSSGCSTPQQMHLQSQSSISSERPTCSTASGAASMIQEDDDHDAVLDLAFTLNNRHSRWTRSERRWVQRQRRNYSHNESFWREDDTPSPVRSVHRELSEVQQQAELLPQPSQDQISMSSSLNVNAQEFHPRPRVQQYSPWAMPQQAMAPQEPQSGGAHRRRGGARLSRVI